VAREVGISTDRSQGDYAAEKVRENRCGARLSARNSSLSNRAAAIPCPQLRTIQTYEARWHHVAEGTINDVEDWLTAPPGLIFAFRDDGDGSWAGHWYPCRRITSCRTPGRWEPHCNSPRTARARSLAISSYLPTKTFLPGVCEMTPAASSTAFATVGRGVLLR